ncbi:MAG: dihydropteroate synthase [Hyphomicrobiales bacterium]
MTARDVYLKPTGIVCGKQAQELVAAGQAGWLAGRFVAFTHLELLSRNGNGPDGGSYAGIKASNEHLLVEALESLGAEPAPVSGLDFTQPHIMGILNVTPDSFSDGGLFAEAATAIAHGRRLVEEGAHILDIGGESTRPGADKVTEEDEIARVIPVLEGLEDSGTVLSCDTRNAPVMKAAASAGAHIINDVSALGHDPSALETAAALNLPVVLMHSQGEPKTMQQDPQYEDVCLDVFDTLEQRIAVCEAAGIERSKIIADPGIGFGKTFDHNLQLIDGLTLFHGLGVPLMLGASRKAFIGAVTGTKTAGERVQGSVAVALAGLIRGAHLFRVHDVAETAQAFATFSAISRQSI